MSFPEPVQNFLDWLQAESEKPGVTLERQEEIAQTMCDLANRQLLFSDEETPGTPLTQKDKTALAERISAQTLLQHREIAQALSASLDMAHSLCESGSDDPEEFAHGIVWFIKDYVTVKMLSGLWRQVVGAQKEDPDWSNLVWSVFESVKPRKTPSPRNQLHPLERLREGALPLGILKQGYRVMVDDNSELSQFNVRWCLGEYASYDAAEKAARGLVENSLLCAGAGALSAQEVFNGYSTFGDDPFIEAFGGAAERSPKFSAWAYAGSLVRKVVSQERQPKLSRSHTWE